MKNFDKYNHDEFNFEEKFGDSKENVAQLIESLNETWHVSKRDIWRFIIENEVVFDNSDDRKSRQMLYDWCWMMAQGWEMFNEADEF